MICLFRLKKAYADIVKRQFENQRRKVGSLEESVGTECAGKAGLKASRHRSIPFMVPLHLRFAHVVTVVPWWHAMVFVSWS